MSQERKDFLIRIIAVLSLLTTVLRFITEPNYETFAIVLSTIATILTLYASKKRIENAERRYTTKPKQLFNVSVALWGPTKVGKTWLCHAFGRTLQTKYQREIDGLVYELETVNKSDYSYPPNYGSAGVEAFVLRFARSRTSESYAQSISSFRHEIRIFDNQGSQTTEPFEEKIKSPSHTLEHNTATINIAHADIVFIVLDPTYYYNLNGDVYESEENFLKVEYPRLVRNLIRFLETDKSNRDRYYAVCISKADYIDGGVYVDPDTMIEFYFGEEMTKALKIPDPKRIKTFTTSSAGYIMQNGHAVPNISAGMCLDVDNWQPYGVEFPFFWAFEELEKQSLRDRFQNSWWKRLTLERELKKYIPYPKSNYELPKTKP